MEAQKPLEQETPETTPQEVPTATIPQPESTPAANMEADPIPEEMDASPESPTKKTAGKLAALIGGGIVAVLGRDVTALPTDRLGNRRLGEGLFLEPGERFDWPDPAAPDSGTEFCHGLRSQIAVLCDGTVVPCCLDSEGRLALGNLHRQELAEILASPRATAMATGFSRRQPSEELCRRCGYAARFSR